jgi:hypothetical protein
MHFMILTTIGNNQIGDNGAIAIAEALKINTTLTTITLGIYNAFYNPYYYRRQSNRR